MIDLGELHDRIRRKASHMQLGDCFSVRTYQGDRGFRVQRTESGFLLKEDGFSIQSVKRTSLEELLKAAKRCAKREFPRSNKLHLNEGI